MKLEARGADIMFHRRIRTQFLIAALIAAGPLVLGCGDPSTPTLAQSQSQSQTQSQSQSGSGSGSAKVRSTGTLNFADCSGAGCTAQGTIVNDGPGCVSNVKGVTHLLDSGGKEIEARSWEINGRVRPDAPKSYQACCFSANAKDHYASFRVDITFQSIDCI